jgi:hypothetical protein
MNYLNQPRKILTFEESIELGKCFCKNCKHYSTIVNLSKCDFFGKTINYKDSACIYYLPMVEK